MARRSIWNGAISFGMVVIPVKLYPATDSKDIHFVTLHTTCNSRIRQPRFCSYHETTVESAEIVRAYEYAKDQYIIMEDADFADLPVPSKHTIDITRFVSLESIDPIFFERTYALEPQEIGLKPFYLLKRALETTGRVAVAKVSIRQKENLCCLRPYEHGLMMQTMHYPDEIRALDELALPEEQAEVSDQEMNMAVTLIDQLTGDFSPAAFQDEYRLALEKVIEQKLIGADPVIPEPVAPMGKVGDLMEALKASIEATKTERSSRDNGAAMAEATVVEKTPPEPVEEAAPKKRRSRAKAKA